MIEKKCKQCGNNFIVHNYRKNSANYCSRNCIRKGKKPYNYARTEKECVLCAKKFSVQPAFINKKYCSYKCYWKSLLGVHKETPTTFKGGELSPNWRGGDF